MALLYSKYIGHRKQRYYGSVGVPLYISNEYYSHVYLHTVMPDPPENLRHIFSSGTDLRYEWKPPMTPVIGGIKGYNITFYGDCGTCAPLGMVDNETFVSTCISWTDVGLSCQFKVRTVTDDCDFESEPATLTTLLAGR